jgi:hypothetical protein
MIWKLSAFLNKNFPGVLTLLQNFTLLEWIGLFGLTYFLFSVTFFS